MGIFKKFFGQRSKKAIPPDNVFPSRSLQLQYPVTPGNGSLLAQVFVDAVKQIENRYLDFSAGTVEFVDSFLQRFHDEGLRVDDFAETIFVAGCYVGEVMAKNNGGHWIDSSNLDLPGEVTMSPIVIKLANGNVSDPIAKAFKRFSNGEVDNLGYFYHVFTKEKQGS